MGLETEMRGRDSIFDCVNLLYYKCQKANFKRERLINRFSGLNKKEKENNKSLK